MMYAHAQTHTENTLSHFFYPFAFFVPFFSLAPYFTIGYEREGGELRYGEEEEE